MPFLAKKRRRRSFSTEENPKISSPPPTTENISVPIKKTNCDGLSIENAFAVHMSNYIGQTVTVFVSGGGFLGAGFTGVLINSSNTYIKLLTKIGPAPACSLGNSCGYLHNYSFISSSYNNKTYNFARFPLNVLGSVTYIPSNKIVSFVHNRL